jgi:multicomponent Na+:H+ antiporter subunit G
MVETVTADVVVIVGLVFMTLGVAGLIRMPDVYTKLHAASKAVFLGIIALAVSVSLVGTTAMTLRLILLSVLVLLTTPVSAHAIALGAHLHRERMNTPGAIDESGRQSRADGEHEPSWRV